jgi:ABC-type transporter Mla subunit MlaD
MTSVVSSNVAPKPAAAPAVLGANSDEAKAKPEAAKPSAKLPEGPNVLGGAVAAATGAVNAAGKLATVARAELDRELARTHTAQKQAAAYKKQVDDLTKQLAEARAQLAALNRARQPPPPSDQEQILQMLAPVLRTSNDGRP